MGSIIVESVTDLSQKTREIDTAIASCYSCASSPLFTLQLEFGGEGFNCNGHQRPPPPSHPPQSHCQRLGHFIMNSYFFCAPSYDCCSAAYNCCLETGLWQWWRGVLCCVRVRVLFKRSYHISASTSSSHRTTTTTITRGQPWVSYMHIHSSPTDRPQNNELFPLSGFVSVYIIAT